MKVLITGGAGYIGSHVVNKLGNQKDASSNPYDIVVADNLSTGRADAVMAGKLEVLDIGNLDEMNKFFERHQFDAVLHFAGSIIVPESVEKPLEYYNNNTRKTLELIKLCREYNVDKFIFSSTAAVYGIPAGGVCSEDMTTHPINPYGRTKLMTEWMLEDSSNAGILNYVALRYFNVAGANVEGKIGQSTPNATHLIKIAAETVAGKRNYMNIFGTDYDTEDGTCIRDYIHVDDLAQAHVDALQYLEKGKKDSQVLNCGYGHGFSVRQVIDVVKKVSGEDIDVREASRRPGDAPVLMSKCEKIKSVLGWEPQYDDLELIVKTAIEWEKKL